MKRSHATAMPNVVQQRFKPIYIRASDLNVRNGRIFRITRKHLKNMISAIKCFFVFIFIFIFIFKFVECFIFIYLKCWKRLNAVIIKPWPRFFEKDFRSEHYCLYDINSSECWSINIALSQTFKLALFSLTIKNWLIFIQLRYKMAHKFNSFCLFFSFISPKRFIFIVILILGPTIYLAFACTSCENRCKFKSNEANGQAANWNLYENQEIDVQRFDGWKCKRSANALHSAKKKEPRKKKKYEPNKKNELDLDTFAICSFPDDCT